MAKFKNISPAGELEVPALNQSIPRGAVAEIPDHLVDSFVAQPDVWKRMPGNTKITAGEKN